MALISPGDADRFIRKPDPRYSIILLYGPDHGLIMERGAALAAAVTGGSDDPMQTVRLEGDAVAADPLKLADEANTISMFGGKRAIRLRVGSLRGGTKSLLPALEPLIAQPPLDATVIIEMDDVPKRDPVVTLCTSTARTAVVACYGDSARDLGDIIADAVRAGGKSIDPDARAHLQNLLGGDRIATKGELEKLMLFTGDAPRITLEHIDACVGDTANAMMDSALDGAFAGDVSVMMMALERLKAEGTDANALLMRALSHAWRLAQVLDVIKAKGRTGDSWKLISPAFPRKALIERQFGAWTTDAVMKQIRTIGEAVHTARSTARLANAAVDRTFLGITLAARRQR